MFPVDSHILARLRHLAARAATVVLSATLVACGDGVDCSAIGAPQGPMFQVEVRDAATTQPAWWGANGHIEDGDFREDLRPSSTDPNDSLQTRPLFSLSYRAGTYTVRVEKPGFLTWSDTGLVVETEGCFLTTHFLEARLERVP